MKNHYLICRKMPGWKTGHSSAREPSTTAATPTAATGWLTRRGRFGGRRHRPIVGLATITTWGQRIGIRVSIGGWRRRFTSLAGTVARLRGRRFARREHVRRTAEQQRREGDHCNFLVQHGGSSVAWGVTPLEEAVGRTCDVSDEWLLPEDIAKCRHPNASHDNAPGSLGGPANQPR